MGPWPCVIFHWDQWKVVGERLEDALLLSFSPSHALSVSSDFYISVILSLFIVSLSLPFPNSSLCVYSHMNIVNTYSYHLSCKYQICIPLITVTVGCFFFWQITTSCSGKPVNIWPKIVNMARPGVKQNNGVRWEKPSMFLCYSFNAFQLWWNCCYSSISASLFSLASLSWSSSGVFPKHLKQLLLSIIPRASLSVKEAEKKNAFEWRWQDRWARFHSLNVSDLAAT